jgi:hypothetical protein
MTCKLFAQQQLLEKPSYSFVDELPLNSLPYYRRHTQKKYKAKALFLHYLAI